MKFLAGMVAVLTMAIVCCTASNVEAGRSVTKTRSVGVVPDVVESTQVIAEQPTNQQASVSYSYSEQTIYPATFRSAATRQKTKRRVSQVVRARAQSLQPNQVAASMQSCNCGCNCVNCKCREHSDKVAASKQVPAPTKESLFGESPTPPEVEKAPAPK